MYFIMQNSRSLKEAFDFSWFLKQNMMSMSAWGWDNHFVRDKDAQRFQN